MADRKKLDDARDKKLEELGDDPEMKTLDDIEDLEKDMHKIDAAVKKLAAKAA